MFRARLGYADYMIAPAEFDSHRPGPGLWDFRFNDFEGSVRLTNLHTDLRRGSSGSVMAASLFQSIAHQKFGDDDFDLTINRLNLPLQSLCSFYV